MQEWFHLAMLALKVSISVQVFAIGLASSLHDATYLFRHPPLLWKSILARNVVAPVVAILLINAFSLRPAIAITLAVLSLTPVPPLLPKTQLKAGASAEYGVGLLVSQGVLAVVLVPVTVRFMDWALGAQARFGAWQVALLMAKTILAPLALGMLASRLLPKLRNKVQILLRVGSALLIAGLIPLLPVAWKAYGVVAGNGTILAFAIFMILGTAAGHFLGGPADLDRTTLAIATSARHPAIAIAIASANFPNQSKLVSAAVLIYLILRVILAIPYMLWRKSPREQPSAPMGPLSFHRGH